MGFDRRDERRDDPDNIIDAGLRGIARGIEGLRGIMSQIADPAAPARPRPVSGPGRRPPRRQPRPLASNSAGAREPLVDVFDEGALIRVVADMPGADPETLRIEGVGRRLLLAAAGPARRYERTVVLPAAVHAEEIAPTFVNGIMEVLLPAVRETPVPPPAATIAPIALPGNGTAETAQDTVTPLLANGAHPESERREDLDDDRDDHDRDGSGDGPAR